MRTLVNQTTCLIGTYAKAATAFWQDRAQVDNKLCREVRYRRVGGSGSSLELRINNCALKF